MLQTARAARGMTTAPHALAAESGLAVLRDGGNAIEAMIAMAATIAVVYPHMNGLGGDGFWLIAPPGADPVAIDAAGRATVDPDWYAAKGLDAIPARGSDAVNMVAGTLDGWRLALDQAARLGGTLAPARLMEDAIWLAENGAPVSESQARLTAAKRVELEPQPGFAPVFLPGGAVPKVGSLLKQPALADTLRAIARDGPDAFYRGALARRVAADLARAGCPVRAADLAAYRAQSVTPLSVDLRAGRVFNMPPPTQGLASLIILGIAERLGLETVAPEGADYYHLMVEAVKQAFLARDAHIGDPDAMTADPAQFLTPAALDAMAAKVDPVRALPWPHGGEPGDTIWMGAVDGDGTAVSFIQSFYWEFGTGVVLEDTGLIWENRGHAFQLEGAGPRVLARGRKPFHTLNPALARLGDGRVVTYGCMGGEGQPQTQAALFTRVVQFGREPQAAITAPRWLLGRTWGAESVTLKFENRVDPAVLDDLRARGHAVEVLGAFDDTMGHAGMIVRHPDGRLEGASDPRSDGAALGF